MTIDGKAIARDILREVENMVSHRNVKPHVTVFTSTPNLETRTFLAIKKREAERVGIGMNVIEFPETITTDEVIQSLRYAEMQTDGIVVQLPFPPPIAIDRVLAAVPPACDVDAFSYEKTGEGVLPPVVGAIDEIARRHGVPFVGARVVVVGDGKLVGRPAAVWARRMGAQVTVVTKETEDRAGIFAAADILILGAGSPHMVTPEMVRDGVAIFDAGTSEAGGVIVGDAHPDCAFKASLFTPVPNGIGPITVAVLLRNVVLLAEGKRSRF